MEGERVDRAGGTSHQHITSPLETLPSAAARRARGRERGLKGQRQLAFLQPDYRSAEPAPVNSRAKLWRNSADGAAEGKAAMLMVGQASRAPSAASKVAIVTPMGSLNG